MKEMKRIISLLLCLVMLAGYLPVNARAEEAMTTEPSAVETAEETAAETTEETEPEKPGKPAGPKGPGKHEKPGKPEPVKPEAPKPEQETVPETTEATVPVTEETVPETTEATAPATEETVPETTEETEPVMMMAAPKAAIYQVPAQYAQQGYEAVDAAVIFTDLHTMYNGNSSEGEKGYKKTIITNMMTALKDTGLKFSSVTSGGDAFSENGTAYGKCYTDTITGYIQGVLGAIPVNYVWSDHDRTAQNNATEKKMVNKKSHLAFANENYYVYALSMGDICSFDRYDADFNDKDRAAAGFTATIDDAIAGFKAEVAKMDKTRPLLIVSHLPLFDARNDNAFAEKWYNAISEAAKEMDVFFYYGHNHNHDTGNDYYYGKGSTMNVATTGGWTDYQTGIGNNYFNDLTPAPKTNINFTHLCGGYMEPSSTGNQSSKTRQGTVLVTVLLQDAEGNEAVHLVTYGSNGEYTGNYALNTVVESIYEKSVTTPDQGGNEGGNQGGNSGETTEVKKDEATGITVAAPGVTGVSVEVKTPASVPAGYTAYASYDINLEGYTQGDAATVTVPAPAGFNADRPVVVLHDGEQIATTDIVDGKITFTTNHFSVYDVAQVAADELTWIEIPGENKDIFRLTDKLTDGKKYVIASTNAAGSATVTNLKADNKIGAATATVIADAEGNYIEDPDTSAQWTYTNSRFQNVHNIKRYLRGKDNDLTSTDNTNKNYITWSLSSGNLRVRESNWSDKYRYMTSVTKTADREGTKVYLYVADKIQTESCYATMEGTTEFTFNVGEKSEAEIKNAVKSAIKVYTADDANGTGKALANDYQLDGTVNSNAQGEYTLSVQYGSKELGKIKVKVAVRTITGIAVPSPITVFVGTGASRKIADITVTYDDKSTTKVPLTLNMLQGSFNTDEVGIYEGLTVAYGGKTATVTLNVIEKVVNNYPEYPDEGAVKVNKTGTGIDFQSSGIAQVEVSASGVPMKKGADVIVMLDTSSSMTKNEVEGSGGKMRSEVLEESLKNLIAYFKTPGEDGEPMDLRVAIADFNGYYGHGSGGTSNTPYDRTEGDYVKNGNSNGSGYQQPSKAKVYTGTGLNAGAFIDAAELEDTYTLNYTSGTNYDYAFDAIFQLGTAIKAANGEEQRDLYVIFMSDGASLQWNYFGTQNTYTKWNNWLAGTWDADDLTTSNLNSTKHSYFYDLKDHDGDGHINEHRMANAIKGDPNVDYEIIRKSTAGLPAGTLTAVAGKDYLYTVKGLGATMFTINFDAKQDGQITVDSIDKALASTASDQTGTTKYYYKVTKAAELANAFDAIGSEIAYAAYNARFVDQMGANYNLQMETATYELKDGTKKTLAPQIEILSYDIYTKADAEADKIPEGSNIGDRKGTKTLLEVVKFSADGKKAYSNLIDADKDGVYGVTVGTNGSYTIADTDDNILNNGVIAANTFWYNTTASGVTIEGVSIPTGKDNANLTTGSTNVLPAETFYWKMGTVQSKELAMRYHVYLDGSMEGTRGAGSYPTNEFATLYYDNYVHKPCYKETVSPVLAWKEANVSYAFYLVNENGEIIINQNTGETGAFANKIAVTNPVVYKTVILNSGADVEAKVLAGAEDVLPKYYTLYDEAAAYQVKINSNGTGSWAITKGGDVNASTYVTQYKTDNPAAYSKDLTNNETGDDYTHTVVWFAVEWTVGAYPDSVVIDYGLPVEISVLSNDMFGDYGSLAGIGAYNTEGLIETGHTTSNVLSSQTYTGTFGTATADTANGKIRYELNKSNGMQMNTYEKFGYAVDYKGSNSGYYYSSVTVIPATTIYYEDNFLDFASYHTVDEDKDSVADTYVENGMTMVKYEKDTTSAWTLEGNGVSGATQSEDRPGKYALQDANNIYGYDGVNKGMSMHSLNQARKVYVSENSYATASFQFAGTGFDVISMTSNTTGAIAVQVKAAENIVVNNTQKYAKGAVVKSFFVNTYYGYTQGDDGEWVATPDVAQAIYQVPVLQVENLDYGKYDVTITATYSEYLDKTNAENGKKGYDLYLDAVRIYDPANDGAQDNDTVIEDAYKADGEGWPSYIELRNKLIAADTILGNYGTEDEPITGVVFIDGDGTVGNDQIADYISYGPNNEVYLAPGQRVAFMLSNVKNNGNIAGIHVGIKSADGKTCKYTIANYAQNDTEGGASAGDMYHEKISTVDTTTDMYYDLTDWRNDIIVISNTGSEGILSLTNIKATYKNNPNGTVATGDGNENDGIMVASELDETSGNEVDVYMTPRAAMLTLRSMNAPAEEEIPEPSVPETSEPEETLPEETKPGKPGKDEKPGKPSKPGKDEKPGKPGKDEKPGKPGKDEKPGKPGKDEKPGKPGKDEKPGKAKKG